MRPRPPTNPEALVRYRVGQLRDKFEYPDEIGGGPAPVAGGGGGAPTVVVAASDASDLSKSKADYECTGANDQEVIQGAMDNTNLPTFFGGRLLLTEGTFHFSWPGDTLAAVLTGDAWFIQGMGQSTVISITGTPSANPQVCIELPGESGIRDVGIFNSTFPHPSESTFAIRVNGAALIENVVMQNFNGSGGDYGAGAGVVLEGANESTVRACRIENCAIGIVSNSDRSFIHGNYIQRGTGMRLLQPRNVVTGNILQPFEDGILIEDSSDHMIIAENMIIDATDTDNTYDAIRVEGSSDLNRIHGNTIIPEGARRFRYGVNIASGACNIVVGNDLGPAADYGTDALNDAGADTRLFWPNDATYGDNFIGCFGS